MIVLYPTQDWDSFVDVTFADTHLVNPKWVALTTPQKEELLKESAMMIRLCSNIALPKLLDKDLQMAQIYLLRHSLVVDMISFDPNARAVTEEHAGSVGHSFEARYKAKDNFAFPPMVIALLKQYGCTNSGGCTQTYIGRS